MKIAIITGLDPFNKKNKDGGSTSVFNYIKYLTKKGCIVDVFLTKMENNEMAVGKYFKQKIMPGVMLIKLNTWCIKKIVNKNEDIDRVKCSIRATDILKNFDLEKYDIIHISHMTQSIGPVLKLNLTDKIIIAPLMLGKFYKKYQKISSKYLKLEKDVCNKARYFRVTSKNEKDVLINYYKAKKAKIFIHKEGLDLNTFKFKERQKINLKKLNIISVNAIRPQKNQIFFINFVKKCLKKNIIPIIHIVGSINDVGRKRYDTYKNNFIGKIKKEKLECFFKLHGYLEQKALNSLAKSMDLAIFPSLFETFGMAILESICMGIPTIVFNDIPAYREFIIHRKNGMMISRNVDEVIKSVKELANDNNLYRYISKQGKQMRKRFSWCKAVKQLLDSYNVIIADNK